MFKCDLQHLKLTVILLLCVFLFPQNKLMSAIHPLCCSKLPYLNLIHLHISIYSPLQMDPKLRPSFQVIVRNLEEILARLKVEEMEHECVPLSGDIDKKTIPKGNSTSASAHFSFNFPVTKSHLPLFTRSCL